MGVLKQNCSLDDTEILAKEDRSDLSLNGLYQFKVRTEISVDTIQLPASLYCILTVPGTDYVKRRETIYYGN